MTTFRALCLAAAMALMVTCALPQGRGRGNDDRGGSSGGPARGGGGSDQGRGNDNRGNDNRGNDNRGGGSSNNSGGSGQGRGNDNRGNDNRGNDNRGGGSSGGPANNNNNNSGGGQGRGNDNKGNDDRRGGDTRGGGSGTSGGPANNGGGSQGGPGRGNDNKGNDDRRGGDTRGGGSGTSGGPVNNGGGSQGGPGRGNDNKGDDRKGGDTRGGGSGTSGGPANNGGGSQGGPGRGNDNKGDDRKGGDTRGGGSTSGGGSQGGPGRGGDTRGGGTSGGDIRGGGSSTGGSQGGPGRGGDIRGGDTRGGSSGDIRGGSQGGPGRGNGGTTRGNGGGITIIGGGDGRVSDSMLDHKISRSGTSRYGTSNNVRTITKVGSATVIGRAPRDLSSIKRHQITREEQIRLNHGGVRVGYYFYDPRWCDDYFWYPYYTSDPWSIRCVVSPWYYYPMLPGYVSYDRCRFYRLDPWRVWFGNPYQWQRPVYYGNYDVWGRRGSEVDYAIDDIVSAFENADRRAAGRLVPSRSEVAIYIDGDYSYTLNADDFYDMFMDATQNTKTIRYSIERVERGRDNYSNTVRVTARHEYEDPWGMRTSVTHYYELRYEGRNLVISKFGVGN